MLVEQPHTNQPDFFQYQKVSVGTYDWNENEGMSHETIGRILGMSKTNVSYYYSIVKQLASDIIRTIEDSFTTNVKMVNEGEEDLVNGKVHQVNKVSWQFRWFREITPLSHKHQRQIIEKIIANYPKVATKQIQEWAEIYKARQALQNYLEINVPNEYLEDYLVMLDTGTYDAYVKQEVEDTFVTQNLENVTNNDGSNVTSNVTRVTIDWQFSWFRHITPLPYRYQRQIVESCIERGQITEDQFVYRLDFLGTTEKV